MRALITGVTPGSGIGFETAQLLAAQGNLVFAGVHTLEQLERACDLPKTEGIVYFKFDVTDPEDRELATMLDIDTYFGVAGIGVTGSMAEIDMDQVRHAFETNVFSMFEVAQKLLPGMIAKGRGRLVFTSSLFSYIPMRFFGTYAATKASIAMMASALRQELAMLEDADIDVSVVMPGAYHTGFNQQMINSKIPWMKEDSLFRSDLPDIVDRERDLFSILEKQSLDTLMGPIMGALTDKRPRFEYKAPRMQALGTTVLRSWKPLLVGGAVVLAPLAAVKLLSLVPLLHRGR